MDHKLLLDALSLEEKVERINAYQELGAFHPLTCEQGATHPNLVPKIEGEQLVLVCEEPGCGYRQTYIPPSSYAKSVADLKAYTEQFRNRPRSEPPPDL